MFIVQKRKMDPVTNMLISIKFLVYDEDYSGQKILLREFDTEREAQNFIEENDDITKLF